MSGLLDDHHCQVAANGELQLGAMEREVETNTVKGMLLFLGVEEGVEFG
jgi:hypothetical protein